MMIHLYSPFRGEKQIILGVFTSELVGTLDPLPIGWNNLVFGFPHSTTMTLLYH